MAGGTLVVKAGHRGEHQARARLEQAGRIAQLVTQNVDGRHPRAGSARVIELHGNIQGVVCLDCRTPLRRADLQARLEAANPAVAGGTARVAPDGDADLEQDFSSFVVPGCPLCGGTLKPDVVFFGANVPRPLAAGALDALEEADAVLAIGSTLMAYSGYRFCEHAHAAGKPVAAINLGRTRADALLELKIEEDCAAVLTALAERLSAAFR